MGFITIRSAEQALERAAIRLDKAEDAATRAYAALDFRGSALEAYDRRVEASRRDVESAWADLQCARLADAQAFAEDAGEDEILAMAGWA